MFWTVKSKKKKKKKKKKSPLLFLQLFLLQFQIFILTFFNFPSFLLHFPYFPCLSFPHTSAEISRSGVCGGHSAPMPPCPPPPPVTPLHNRTSYLPMIHCNIQWPSKSTLNPRGALECQGRYQAHPKKNM